MDNHTIHRTITSADLAWLQRLNFDSLFAIVSWLDPLSILRLSCSCKVFYSAIASNHLIWKRAFHDIFTAYCAAPHSLSEYSVDDLKRFSTRPSRLIKAFSQPERQIQASTRNYVLNPEAFIPSSGTRVPHLQNLRAKLLPGGRWILSGIIVDKTKVYLFCWDRSQSCSETESLSPVAAFSWDEMKPVFGYGGWIQAQLEGASSVREGSIWLNNLFMSATHSLDRLYSQHDVLRLSWRENSRPPGIELVARLEPGPSFKDADRQLQEDYMIINTERHLLLWNWKDGLVGELDLGNYEWAECDGFLVTATPPYLFIVPTEGREVFVAEIPRLHPIGSPESNQPIPSLYLCSYQFFPDLAGFLHLNLYIFDLWKPLSHRGGTVLMQSVSSGPSADLFHLLSLRPTDAIPPVPSSSILVDTLPFNLDLAEPDAITMVEGIGVILLAWPGQTDPNYEPLYASLHPFTENGGLGCAMDREFQLPHTGEADPASLDLISGTTILRGQEAGNDSYAYIVGVVSFD
ncbi:hypothetical protein DL93DRAFT_2103780 [Clavulina sp. PMI_390]|nr:hypothetical protein DL93DRAFT_2103780 [Clavulina sp. PMI_390]